MMEAYGMSESSLPSVRSCPASRNFVDSICGGVDIGCQVADNGCNEARRESLDHFLRPDLRTGRRSQMAMLAFYKTEWAYSSRHAGTSVRNDRVGEDTILLALDR